MRRPARSRASLVRWRSARDNRVDERRPHFTPPSGADDSVAGPGQNREDFSAVVEGVITEPNRHAVGPGAGEFKHDAVVVETDVPRENGFALTGQFIVIPNHE